MAACQPIEAEMVITCNFLQLETVTKHISPDFGTINKFTRYCLYINIVKNVLVRMTSCYGV